MNTVQSTQETLASDLGAWRQSDEVHVPKEVYKGELEALVQAGALLVDVRETEDLAQDAALPGHTHIPLSRLAELTERIGASKASEAPIIFYCRSGLMSYQAAAISAAWTQQPVYYLAGGLLSFSDV